MKTNQLNENDLHELLSLIKTAKRCGRGLGSAWQEAAKAAIAKVEGGDTGMNENTNNNNHAAREAGHKKVQAVAKREGELLRRLQDADTVEAVDILLNDSEHDYNTGPFLCSVHDKPSANLIGNAAVLLNACRAALGCFGKDEDWWMAQAVGPVSTEQVKAGVIWTLQDAIAKTEGK